MREGYFKCLERLFSHEFTRIDTNIFQKIYNYKRDCINEMLKQDFRISKIIYDGALKIAKEKGDKENS